MVPCAPRASNGPNHLGFCALQALGCCGSCCCGCLLGVFAAPPAWAALCLGWALASTHLALGTVVSDVCRMGGPASVVQALLPAGPASDALRYFIECPAGASSVSALSM